MPSPARWLKHLLKSTRGRAKHPVEIDVAYLRNLWQEQDGKCAVSGLSLEFTANNVCAASIDRRDCSLGYVPGNVVLTCQWVNLGRNSRCSVEDFRAVLDRLR